jgi:uncharacterized paraquat-inducible protein A
MQNKEINLIIRLLGMVGIIFCILALVMPWGGSLFTFGNLNAGNIFYISNFTSGYVEAIVFAIMMIIIFILIILSLIFGLAGIINVGSKKSNKFLIAGILSIINLVLYIVGITVYFGSYGIGFIMMIVAAVLFFITFTIPIFTGSVMTTPYPRPQQMYYQNPAQQQPNQPASQQPTHPTSQLQSEQKTTPAETKQKPETTSMFCPECGTKLEGKPKFCSGCGKKLI